MAETGTQRKLVRVPDVTGYPVRKAEMLLAQAGLQLPVLFPDPLSIRPALELAGD